MIDRTLNTIVKDVILKGIVVVYDDCSPTRNRKAAIQKMLLAGQFIADNGANISADSLVYLEKLQDRLVKSERLVVTRWRDLVTHPVDTYRNARDFKKTAGELLDSAITASTKGNLQRLREAHQQAENAVQLVHGAETSGADDRVNVPATQGHAVVPATSTLSTPSSTHLDPGAGGASSPIAYVRFGDSDIRIGPNTRAKLDFDCNTFTMVLFPNHSPGQAVVSQPASARTATRTASVFTATGTARIISQPQRPKPDASSDESSQSDGDDDLSVCMFEWLDEPVITALTEDEGTTESGSDTD
ncbi:hypothetical protein GSI_01648 [Ganoderma sinense ZZ0214-1]|uniref:Uncharacterized protein n=1 Tax=Ganoderma sinense ZZ0214-1 TaxID=1077348 RepID=A0A2G8SQY2_9APHY|nr:hypothetical protein GSI_01648 [Ganoderma sinense ZZ0214-1]